MVVNKGAAAILAAFGLIALGGLSARAAEQAPLRVCADPRNMPFSDAKEEGFENKLATLIAVSLGRPLTYVWEAQASDNPASALDAGRCDLLVGVPAGFDGVEPTVPYYWSSYVLLSRADRKLGISSLKDHRLRHLKIAVASVAGNDLYSPPAHVAAQLGLGKNLVGYPIDGGNADEASRGSIVEAVARGDVDIAAVWGPLAGYFVKHSPVPLDVTVIGDTDEFSSRKIHFELLGLQYEIAMAVRQGDDGLRRQLDAAIERAQPQIDAVLKQYGVPLVEPARLAVATARDGTD
jgi:quinoprotein dehydrogenase-associated probable ABC transporter substrate-binding protein